MRIHRHTAVGFLLVLLSLLIGYRPAAGQQLRTLSQQLVGGEFSYTAKRGDSLISIGARFGVDAAVIAADNNLSASSPLKLGQVLHINNRHIIPKRVEEGILINIPRKEIETNEPFHVISGYRSARTNAFLRAHSTAVAENSLHLVGQAIDIRLPGRETRILQKAAIALKGGGVGYYPKSDFVHLDIGRVRYW